MKTLKLHIVKSLAVLICIVYIMMPINLEIRSVLHSISHSLKVPSYVLQHDEEENHEFIHQNNLQIASSSHSLGHEHEILDFLNSVFENVSNNGDSQKHEANHLDIKINKHITNKQYALIFNTANYVENPVYWMLSQYEMKGYLNNLYRPPEV